jgi:Na+/H+ antiporter NhaC
MRYFGLILWGCLLLGHQWLSAQTPTDTLPGPAPTLELARWTFTPPKLLRADDPFTLTVQPPEGWTNPVTLRIAGQDYPLRSFPAELTLSSAPSISPATIEAEGQQVAVPFTRIAFPLWLSILPPLMAIVLALALREVIISLFLGVFSGAAILGYYQAGSLGGVFSGLLRTLDTYIVKSLTDSSHVSIILFSLLIGGMVSLISRNGGMQGIVNRIARLAKTPRSGQLATWLLGLVVFFDDYANSLVVGNTMRPITDRLNISREKLSYLVDSTAAPVSALAFITTWIAAEIGYIGDGIAGLSGFPEDMTPYRLFVSSLGYAFYPILTLLFILILVWRQRDYGTMLIAERRARSTGEVARLDGLKEDAAEMKDFQPKAGVSIQAFRAVIPVAVLVVGVLVGLLYTGWDSEVWNNAELSGVKKLSTVFGQADSYAALMWASLCAVIVAIGLSLGRQRLGLNESMGVMTSGFKAMFDAVIILTLAWALQGVTDDMHTATFLTDLLGNQLSPHWLPTITFLLAAVIAFSTGSSWGTMAILYPLIIPLAWAVCQQSGMIDPHALGIMANAVACVLGGSVLGDHCSPISDTTILSSLATNCNHIDHVRTQLPYALTVGGIALACGTVPTGFGLPSWASFLLGIGACYAVIQLIGKKVEG